MKQENLNFKKGYDQVQKRHLKTVREEIEKACGFKFERTTFYRKMKGEGKISANEWHLITQIFNKYGITDVWSGVPKLETEAEKELQTT